MRISDWSSDVGSSDVALIFRNSETGAWGAEMPSQDQVIEDVYAREVVMARVGHLIRRKQQEIERIARILRLTASFEGVAAPVPGVITRIVLIGPYARRTWYEDKASLYFSESEFWEIGRAHV